MLLSLYRIAVVHVDLANWPLIFVLYFSAFISGFCKAPTEISLDACRCLLRRSVAVIIAHAGFDGKLRQVIVSNGPTHYDGCSSYSSHHSNLTVVITIG